MRYEVMKFTVRIILKKIIYDNELTSTFQMQCGE